jgi:hypothetical protein
MGLEMTKPIPIPIDFATVALTMNNTDLRAHYGRGSETILRWRKESGMAGFNPIHIQPAERDMIIDMAKTLNIREIAQDTGRSPEGIRAVLLRNGITPIKDRNGQWQKGVKNKDFCPQIAPTRTTRSLILDELRRRDRCAISPCNEIGHYDPNGDHVRYGSRVYTFDRILEKCRAKGINLAY